MATTAIGRAAEKAVAAYLSSSGYRILEQNWRTRWCEIDIIAQKEDVIYFIEVKYRGTEAYGSGFEYIGPNKLRQLVFAANFWVTSKDWSGDFRILAAETTGSDFNKIEILEIET